VIYFPVLSAYYRHFIPRFLKNLSGHNSVINSVTINEDGVMVSGGDDGTLNFWDYETGYCFQRTQTVVQPGKKHTTPHHTTLDVYQNISKC
jgi:WD40 repeat protein